MQDLTPSMCDPVHVLTVHRATPSRRITPLKQNIDMAPQRRFLQILHSRAMTIRLVLVLISFAKLAVAAPWQTETESWWQDDPSGRSSIAINSSQPVAVASAYGLRVTEDVFCGVRIVNFLGETMFGLRGRVRAGRLTILSTERIDENASIIQTDPKLQRILQKIPRNLGPTELFVSTRSLIERNLTPQQPRGLFAVFLPVKISPPVAWTTLLASYCK